jgi:hypothetical protein
MRTNLPMFVKAWFVLDLFVAWFPPSIGQRAEPTRSSSASRGRFATSSEWISSSWEASSSPISTTTLRPGKID